MSNEHYVYAYIREDGSPYYIGKGKGNRAWSELHNVNLPATKDRILLLKENLSDIDARQLEIMLILLYGRKDNGTGILRNLTDGGEGCSGRQLTEDSKRRLSNSLTGRKMSQAWKDKLSSARQKLWETEEYRSKLDGRKGMTGKKHSEETKAKMSLTKTGKIFSVEHRQQLSQAAKDRTPEQNAKYGLVHKGKPWTEARRLAYEKRKQLRENNYE